MDPYRIEATFLNEAILGSLGVAERNLASASLDTLVGGSLRAVVHGTRDLDF